MKANNPAAPAIKREAEEDLGQEEIAMTNDRPWRLADLTFVPLPDGREKAEINGVVVARQNRRYWITTPDGSQWHDIAEQNVDPALNYLFRQRQQ